MKHSGCPAGWLIALRSAQLVLAIGVLGITSFLATQVPGDPDLAYKVALATVTVFWVFVSFVLYCMNKLPPLSVIIVDAIMLVAWIAAVARRLVLGTEGLVFDCASFKDSNTWSYYDRLYDFNMLYVRCNLSKVLFALAVVAMITFIPTIALGSVACRKLRKGRRVAGAGAGAGHVFPPGAPGNTQAPQWVLYNPAAPPVFVPYSSLQPQQPMEPPRPAYDPVGIRYTSPPPPPPQQYINTRHQSPPLPEVGQLPSPTYKFPPRGQQQQRP